VSGIYQQKRRINLLVKDEVHRELTVYCAKTGQKLQGMLEKLIEQFLKDNVIVGNK